MNEVGLASRAILVYARLTALFRLPRGNSGSAVSAVPARLSRGGEHGRYPSALSTATSTGMDASESTVVMNVPCAMVRVLPPYW